MIIFSLLAILIISGCSVSGNDTTTTSIVQKIEASCPRGEVNDPYPGMCGLYVDKDNDDICDLSE